MAVRLIKGHWWIDLHWNGRRYRKRSPGDTREAAEGYAEQVHQWLSYTGALPDDAVVSALECPSSPKATLEAFASEWFKIYVATNLKPNTQRIYGSVLRQHILPFLGTRSIGSISGRDIELLKAACRAKGLHPKSVNAALSVLRRCLTTALDWEVIPQLPRFRWLKVPPPPFDHLTPDESAKLLASCTEEPTALMLRTALRTGLRLGELRALRWEDIDFERGFIAVRRSRAQNVETTPKNNRVRYVPVSLDLREALISAYRRRGHVFTAADGAPLSPDQARKAMRRARKAAGLRPIGWHTLRHSFATQLAASGVPIQAIQGFLGHATLQMTMRYAHFQPSAFKDAVNLLIKGEVQAMHRTAVGTDGHRGAHAIEKSATGEGDESALMLAKNPALGAGSFTWQGL